MGNGREFDQPALYRIRLKGNLDAKWSDWFDGLDIEPQAGNETLLCGQVADQASLHGMLAKIRDLGLPLLLVERVGTASTGEKQSLPGNVAAAGGLSLQTGP